jgi:hypothetical protein
MQPAQIQLVCSGIRARRAEQTASLGTQLILHGMHDGTGNLILQLENVRQRPVIRLGKEMVAVRRIDELGRDSNPLPVLPNTAFQHGFDTQQLRDLPYVILLVLERKRRRTSRYL